MPKAAKARLEYFIFYGRLLSNPYGYSIISGEETDNHAGRKQCTTRY